MAGETLITVVGNLTAEAVGVAVRVTEFWRQVSMPNENGCRLWTGYTEKGYGLFSWDGRMVGAHELALTFTTGERRLPELDTCHRCNVPLCCEPSHLRFDTRASNVADMLAAGTHRNGSTKLTAADVATIRARLAAGARQKDIAEQYGVSNSLVSQIKSGKRWAA